MYNKCIMYNACFTIYAYKVFSGRGSGGGNWGVGVSVNAVSRISYTIRAVSSLRNAHYWQQ